MTQSGYKTLSAGALLVVACLFAHAEEDLVEIPKSFSEVEFGLGADMATADALVSENEFFFWLGPEEILESADEVCFRLGLMGDVIAIADVPVHATVAVSADGVVVTRDDGGLYVVRHGATVLIVFQPEKGYALFGKTAWSFQSEADIVFGSGDYAYPEVRLLGTEGAPWSAGSGVTAYIKDGVLYVKGAGVITSTPWAERGSEIREVVKDREVSGFGNAAVNGLSNLRFVNGFSVSDLSSLSAGVVGSDGFSSIAIDPESGSATLTLVIRKAERVDSEEWKEAGTVDVKIPADTPTGFFKVISQ